ncbi:MAG: ribosome biogenesis GTP-binding protein YihA/YsxC [Cyclobacteriaceae bacterium]
MEIKSAEFVVSNTDVSKCPIPDRPEFAFIGRSNVGKSSLINMLVNRKDLAKTSGKPGKTQTINHFIVNNKWFLVDLPGYGYASVSKSERKGWSKMIENYILYRENLYCVFVLIDCRHEPQTIDLDFITWLGKNQIPLAIVFTKMDKLKRAEVGPATEQYKAVLLKTWEELPPLFISSSEKKTGQKELLDFIAKAMKGQL